MNASIGSPWPRRLSALILAALCCGGAQAQSGARRAAPAPAPVETVEAQKPLVEQAREALANNQAIQALAIARRAEQQSPGDYKAPYYVSFALMELGELAEATAAAQRSQGLAPTPEAKAAVAQLQATLAAQGALSEADRAAAEGLHAKAGRLYQQAWEKGALPPEKALVAADLFQNQLKDGAMAARLLRDLPSRHAGTPVAEEAAKRLVSLGPALQEVARAAVEQARKREPADPERARWLRTAIDADADHRDAHLMLTNDAAENGDWAKLEPQLRLLQRKQWLQALLEGRSLSLGRWQEDARLRALLSDIWGDKRGAELLALNTTQAQPLSADAQRARGERLQALNQAAFEAAGLKAGTGVAFRDCSQCPELLWIPAGPMPQRAESASKLAPWLNRVRILEPLAVGKFEVTFDEWDACSAEGACKAVPEGLTPGTLFDSKWGRGRQPVVNVSWEDAHTYLQWLSRKTGERYRLLSMTEYVYAARAMRSGEELRDGGANCIDCAGRPSDPRTVPVGSYPANPWGFHDMIGNVAEMVSDCNFNITDQSLLPVDGSPVNAQCSHRREHARAQLGAELLAMGGGWSDALGSLGLPVGQGYERRTDLSIGFRVVRTYKAR